MENVTMERKGDKLVVTIDLKHRGSKSTSGKSLTVATTRGNAVIPGLEREGGRIGINAWVPVVDSTTAS